MASNTSAPTDDDILGSVFGSPIAQPATQAPDPVAQEKKSAKPMSDDDILGSVFGPAPKPKEGAWDAFKRVASEAASIYSDKENGGGVLPAAGRLVDAAVPKSDLAIDIARAPITMTQTLAGAANLATGGLAGKALDSIGYNPKAAQEMLSEGYSDSRKKAKSEVNAVAKQMSDDVSNAGGAWDATKAALSGAGSLIASLVTNPSVIQEQVIQTLPDMLFGAGLMGKVGKTIFLGAAENAGITSARAIELMAGAAPASAAEAAAIQAGKNAITLASTKLSWAGHAIEGAQAASQNAWQIREQDPNNLSGQYMQIPAGLITALIGRAASKVPDFGDVQTAAQLAIAGPKGAAGALSATGGFAKRVGKGMVSEGLFQELPQSAQEQIWQNIAQGKPWHEDVLNQGVQGAVAGAVMGGVGGAITRSGQAPAEEKPPETPAHPVTEAAAQPDSPLSRAAVAGNPDLAPRAAAPADPILARAAEIEATVRDGGLMDKLRELSAQNPDLASNVLAALAAAKNAGLPESVRQSSLNVLEAAMRALQLAPVSKAGQQWQDLGLDKQPGSLSGLRAATAAGDQWQGLGVENPTDALAAQGNLARAGAAWQQSRESQTPAGPISDASGQSAMVDGRGNPASTLGQTLVDGKRAPASIAPAIDKIAINDRYTPTPGEFSPPPATPGQSPSSPGKSPAPAAAVAVDEPPAPRKTVSAPKVAVSDVVSADSPLPPAVRQRRAQLSAMVDAGFDHVEQRNGKFFLVNHADNYEMPLDNAGDAARANAIIKAKVDAQAHESINSPLNDKSPATEAQIAADNYSKPAVSRFGLKFKTENPSGSTRSGKDASGKPWSVTMNHHYTGIEGTKSSDGSLVDAFLGDGHRIFVIDQIDPKTGEHDEPKVMVGFRSEEEARKAYMSNYAKDWKGLGAITEMSVPEFRKWVKSDAASRPVSPTIKVSQEAKNDGRGGKAGGQEDGGQIRDGVRGGETNTGIGRSLPSEGPAPKLPGGAVKQRGQGSDGGQVDAEGLSKYDGRRSQATQDAAGKLAAVDPSGRGSLADAGVQGPGAGELRGAVSGVDAGAEDGPRRDRRNDGGGKSQGQPESADGAGAAGAANAGAGLSASGRLDPAKNSEDWAKSNAPIVADAARHPQLRHIRQADPRLEETRALDALLDVFASLTGHRGIAIHDNTNDGFEYKGNTFVSVDRPHMHVAWTIAHEFKHFTHGNPGIKALYDRIWSLIDNEDGKRAYFKYLQDTNKGKIRQGIRYEQASAQELELLQDEMVADFIGKRFADREWLTKLGQEKPHLFGNFIREWIGALSRLISDLRGRADKMAGVKNVDAYITELESAKAIAMEVAEQWALSHKGVAQRLGVNQALEKARASLSAREISAEEQAAIQAELDAEMSAEPIQDDVDVDVTDAEIRKAGIHAEDAFQAPTWKSAGDGQYQTSINGLYGGNRTIRLSIDRVSPGLYETSIEGAWLGPAAGESTGYVSLAGAKDFIRRQIAARELRARGYDLATSMPTEKVSAILDGWEALNALDGDVRKYALTDENDVSIQDLAKKMGLSDAFKVSSEETIHDPDNKSLAIKFQDKKTGEEQGGVVNMIRFGGKWHVSASTVEFKKGGLGTAFYQLAVEYLSRHDLQLSPESTLSGINTYRRTEQMIAAALRNGISNAMVPHPTQRIYGFQNDASSDDEHKANMARMLIANLRNVRELVPDFNRLRYHPETGVFTFKNGRDAEKLVDAMVGHRGERITSKTDARSFGLGRSTLARALLTQDMLNGRFKAPESFSEPILYSSRDQAAIEYASVEAQYKGTDAWMKAPNGEPTKLNERQWVQARTPLFKAWFGPWEKFAGMEGGVWNDGDGAVSKVVDENGEPLVVYHGTGNGGFTRFRTPGGERRGDLGIFASSNRSMARSYVRRGGVKDFTPPETRADLEKDGYEFDVEKADDGTEGHYYVAQDGQGNGPFATEKEAVEDALKEYGTSGFTPTIYAGFMNLRNPEEDNFEGALWNGSREHQWVVEVGDEIQADATGKQYFDSKEDAADFAKTFIADDAEGDEADPLDYVRGADDHFQTTDDVVREGRRHSHDGAIIREVIDDGGGPGYDMTPSDVFVAIRPDQIKSADWNTGEFGDSDDMRFSSREILEDKDGSIEVKGDADEIRSALPDGIKGRKVDGGVRFTRFDAPRVRRALSGESNAYGRAGEFFAKHILRNGKYLGAPGKFSTPQKLPSMRKILKSLAIEGERGRFWYERSSEGILRMVGGDVQEARKFVALLAIYSPQAKVDTNSTFALRAWAQYKAGQPISVKTRVMDAKAAKAMADVDEFWSGEKTGNFFTNLLRMIDPTTEGRQGATIDMWMMRAGQYSNDAPTKTQYAFMESETNRLASELGWEPQQVQAAIWVAMKARMENAGVKKRTEKISEKKGWIHYKTNEKINPKTGKVTASKVRVVDDEQKHRDNWLKQAFEHKVTSADTNGAKFDFADGVMRHIGQVSWEPRPSTKLPILPGVHSAPYEQQVEFQQAVQKALYDEEGGDMLAKKLGLLVDGVTQAPGIWESDVSAGAQARVSMAPAAGGKTILDRETWSVVTPEEAKAIDKNWKTGSRFELLPMVDASQKKLIEMYAAGLGLLLRQDGVGYHRPFYSGNRSQENGIEISVGRPMTPGEAGSLWSAIDGLMKEAGVQDWEKNAGMISSPVGMRIVNFGAIGDNSTFRKIVQAAAERFETDAKNVSTKDFTSDGNLIENNWLESKNGEGYTSRISEAGRSDLLGWLRDVLAPRVQAVFDEFSQRYDWGDPGQIAFSAREDASAGWRGHLDSSEPGIERGSEEPLAGRQDQSGAGRRPDRAVRIEGAVHFGKAEGLSVLSGSASGSGIKGAEQERLAAPGTDPRIKRRVYFYLPVAGGIPQPEIGLGTHVYTANLDNLYDPAEATIQGDGSAFETAVLDAGYDGFVNREQGTAVLLNRDAPVAYQGRSYDQKIVKRHVERIIPKNVTRVSGDELVRRPEASELGGVIRNRDAIKAAAPSFRMEFGEARVKAGEALGADGVLAAAGSPFRFGEARMSSRDPMESYLEMRNRGLKDVNPMSVLEDDIAKASKALELVVRDIKLGKFRQASVPIGPVPHVLRMLGAPMQMLKMDTSIVRKVLVDKHGDHFKDITPREFVMGLYRPALVLAGERPMEVELVSDILTDEGPVMFALKSNASASPASPKVAVIMSAYPKPVAGGGNTIARRILSGRLIYADMLTAQSAITGQKGQSQSQWTGFEDSEARGKGSATGGPNSTSLAQTDTSASNVDEAKLLVKPFNEKYAGWQLVKKKILDGIAERKVKTDVTLTGWIGGKYKGDVSDIPSFSARSPLGFYSELSEQIEKSTMKQAPAAAWKTFIKALSQKGVKPDEIEWTGVNEWLDLQEGKVSKDAILDYLGANGVRVEETVLEEGPNEGKWIPEDSDEEYAPEISNPAKYAQYTLPGGDAYREVLLTLPESSNSIPSGWSVVDQGEDKSGPTRFVVLDEDGGSKAYAPDRNTAVERAVQFASRNNGSAPTSYRSPHWDQPNVLAHIRVNDRTDADGARVLFVEELQSDWGQSAKKSGFQIPAEEIKRLEIESQKANDARADAKTKMDALALAMQKPLYTKATPERKAEMDAGFMRLLNAYNDTAAPAMRATAALQDAKAANDRAVPKAPFIDKTDKWLTLALKRIVKMAVDGGYDKVAFVNGEQSADRYDLSKQVESVSAIRLDNGDFDLAVKEKSGKTSSAGTHRESALADVVGKDLAAKIISEANGKHRTYSGLDLKVGGEGMKTFYDSIVPNATKALLKKLGGGQMESLKFGGGWDVVDTSDRVIGSFPSEEAARQWIADTHGVDEDGYNDAYGVIKSSAESMEQSGFTITPAMREKAEGGLPMFSAREPGQPGFDEWFSGSVVTNKDGTPKIVFRGEHGDVSNGRMQTDLGSYTFTDNKDVADTYAREPNDYRMEAKHPRILEAYLSIKKPVLHNEDDPFVDFSLLIEKFGKEAAAELAVRHAERIEYTGNWMEDEAGRYTGLDSVEQLVKEKPELIDTLYMEAFPLLDDPEFVALAKSRGYDGAIHVGNGASHDSIEYRVFDADRVGLHSVTKMYDEKAERKAAAKKSSDSSSKKTPKAMDESMPGDKVFYRRGPLGGGHLGASFFTENKSQAEMYARGEKGVPSSGGLVQTYALNYSNPIDFVRDPSAREWALKKLEETGEYGWLRNDIERSKMVPHAFEMGYFPFFEKAGILDAAKAAGHDAMIVNEYTKDSEPTVVLLDKSLAIKTSEGGLSFSARDLSAAKAAGFDVETTYYHGTTAADFKSFRLGKGGVNELGPGIYLTSDPRYAEAWAGKPEQGGRIIPALIRKGDIYDLAKPADNLALAKRIIERNPPTDIERQAKQIRDSKSVMEWTDDEARIVNQAGADGLWRSWLLEPPGKLAAHIKAADRNTWLARAGYVGAKNENSQIPGQIVVFDARNIRSPWAKFDPKKVDSADLLKSARDVTETPEFKAWFGDSKVVDADGKPLVVYHGTAFDVSAFDPARRGANGGSDSWHGDFFTDDPGLAWDYASNARARAERMGDKLEAGENIMPVYLSLQDPILKDFNGRPYNGKAFRLLLDKAKANGRDGAIIRNVEDGPWDTGRGGYDTVYVTFSPDQIKSAIGNDGYFSPGSPDIRASARDGDYELRQSAREVVGDVGRTYTPEQLKAFARVGFEFEKPSLKERAQALWKDAGKKLSQGLFDQFAPVRELSQEAYGLLRLAKGSAGSFETLLKGGKLKLTDGVYDFDDAHKGGVIDELLIPMQGEHHDFLRWVAANRADGLLAEGRENLFTPEDIAAIKTLSDGQLKFDYTIKHGPNAGQTTRSRAQMYADSLVTFNEFSKNVLDMASQSGLIDEESRHLWEGEFYVPFYRVSEEDGFQGVNIKGGAVRQKAFQKLKGGTDVLNADLLDNTLMNWAHLLDASAKNRAAKASLEAAEAAGAAIPASEDVARQIGKATGNRNGVVWFMDQGLQRFYLVEDPYLMSAITSLEYAGMRNPVMNAMSAVKHYLTVGVTASPFFKVRNLIRDSVQAVASAELSYNPAKNLAEGWSGSKQNSDLYFRLLAGGGTIHFGTMLEGSEARRVQSLVEAGVNPDNILDNSHKIQSFYKRLIKPAIEAYNELGNRGETINRAALYKQLIAQGKSHAEASLMARDLMDFSMQGNFTTIRFLTQVVPFLNARLQGLNKLGKAAKENPRRMAIVVGAAAMASLALLALYSDDDDWKRREDWDRDNFWWFKVGGVAFRVPKPFEVGAIGTLAERSAELIFSDEMTGERFRSRVLALLGDNLSMNPIPQLVKPMLDVYANKDSFSGRPIETMGMDRLRPEYRFTASTSMTARGASVGLNAVTGLVGKESLSPVQVDSLIRGYFGWLGTFIVGGVDIAARAATDQPSRPTPDFWKAATGSMISQLEDAPSRYVSHVYDQARVLEQAYGTWRSLQKEGKTEEAADFLAANEDQIRGYRNVEAIKGAIAKINQRMREVERSDMDRDAKRDEIRRLNQRKDEFSRRLAA